VIFEKFRQVGDTLTEKPAGTGLGLAICRQLTAALGGAISVESEPNRGSTFFVRLPLGGPPLKASTEPPLRAAGAGGRA